MILIQDAVLNAFRIERIVKLLPIKAGLTNRAWLVEVQKSGAAGQQQWFLREHRDKSLDRLEFELRFSKLLIENGLLLVPCVIPEKDGRPWFSIGNSLFSMHPYIQADEPFDWLQPGQWSVEHCTLAGSALFDFHRASAKAVHQLPGDWREPAQSALAAGADIARTSHLLSHGADMLEDSKNDAVRAELLALGPDCIRQMNSHFFDKGHQKILDEQSEDGLLVHGDYHPGNVLFRDGRLVAVTDFDFVHQRSLRYDLAYAIYYFGALWQGVDRKLCDETVAFFESYNRQASSVAQDLLPKPLTLEELLPYIDTAALVTLGWLLMMYVEIPACRDELRAATVGCIRDVARNVGNRCIVA